MLSQNTIVHIVFSLVKYSDLISKINQKFPLTLLEPADNYLHSVLVYNRTIMKNKPTNKKKVRNK